MVDKQRDSQFLWHAYKNFSILFMGDTEKKMELFQSVRVGDPRLGVHRYSTCLQGNVFHWNEIHYNTK